MGILSRRHWRGSPKSSTGAVYRLRSSRREVRSNLAIVSRAGRCPSTLADSHDHPRRADLSRACLSQHLLDLACPRRCCWPFSTATGQGTATARHGHLGLGSQCRAKWNSRDMTVEAAQRGRAGRASHAGGPCRSWLEVYGLVCVPKYDLPPGRCQQEKSPTRHFRHSLYARRSTPVASCSGHGASPQASNGPARTSSPTTASMRLIKRLWPPKPKTSFAR